jgi:predicted transposase YbfD/YdcC
MGTQKEIARRIVDKGADYLLALKGNPTSLHKDAALFFADPACAEGCAREVETDAGHGRIEERKCSVADAAWLAERHPDWKGLRSLAAITARRIDKKTGAESLETRYYVTSLKAEPKAILKATRAHWGIENNLHWTMDVTFDEIAAGPAKTIRPSTSPSFATPPSIPSKPTRRAARCGKSASEPASTRHSELNSFAN